MVNKERATENEEIQRWLDALIANMDERYALRCYSGKISTVATFDRSIQLYEGIETVAGAMGIPLSEKEVESESRGYHYEFTYRGTKFVQWSKKKLVVTNVQV